MHTVIAVVPTYRPDPGVLERLDAIAEQLDRVVVVDDGSPSSSTVLDEIEARGHILIRRARNGGIATALNDGIARALADGAEFVVNLDQDTVVPPGYVDACLDTFDAASPATRLGIVCADAINGHPSIPPRHSPEGFGLVDEAIQSGLVISAKCLRTAGLMDDRLVIDCVDTEFCLRVRAAGFRIAVAAGTNLEHSLGEQALFRPFGFQRYVNGEPARYQYHSPMRRYYITRNNIDLALRCLRSRPRWVLSMVRREVTPAIKTITSGPHRARHLLAAVTGVAHGLARRRGMIPAALQASLTPSRG
ncbi:glycosyltransferase [Luethyella okanaganae]|uniref:Glycosyltransferase n=1 Tax=Luethyella okanaganae TaxID=69372 RepID=A0ABW1VAM5_9MICO